MVDHTALFDQFFDGRAFPTYKDLEDMIISYEQTTWSHFTKRSSIKRDLPGGTVYDYLLYYCVYADFGRRNTAEGTRTSSSGGSRNCGCQASFAVRRGDEGLMVTNKYMVHNHAVSLTEFKAHPRNRKLSEDQRRDAGLLLKYGCPNSALRTMSRLEYGTDLTSYDVSNLRSGSVRTRPKRQRLDQEDGADLSSNEEGASSSHPSETTQRSGSSAHKPHICGVCSIADDRRMVTCEHCSWVVHFACSLVLGNGKQCKQCGNDIKLMPQRKLRRRFSNPRIPQARCTLRRRRLVPEQALNELPQEALEGSDVYDDDSSNAEYGERSLVELKRELKEEEDGNPDCAPILRSILKDMDVGGV